MAKASDYVVVGEIDSDSQPGILHLIKRLRSNGALSCDCMAWRFARGEKTCKHVDAFRAAGLRSEIRNTVAAIKAGERDVAGIYKSAPMAIPPAFTEQPIPRPGVRRLRLRD
ncbi:hypothetical protein LCGC14_1813710 [marine sediment metagenome]|uniref:SWIM-type domain-containing protein n=1 Tax=marine sediment metagenome TaxID=412755 RepID=A0A0F9GKT2_9ZZZZ